MRITLGQYRLDCYLPESGEVKKAVYLHTAAKEAESVWKLTEQDFVLVSVEGIDWNRDLSPWPQEKVFAGGEAFAGGAEVYLETLTGRLVPAVEQAFFLKPEKRYLAGYSLGALFAVYAVYHTALFDGIGSISGSLWYNGFSAYVEEHTVRRNPDKIYFSLGDKEASSARGIMQTVLLRTRQIEEKFRKDGIPTILEMNRGNHFKEVPERIAKGIRWLLL
ncbi:MAG: alpha/beta hydrolase-fold protein [Blautia sp.]|nr:alpha/beta hydrolase-fold protein [Blautia sp.]MCM1200373.1 alpha/beta hydrolase-fold protein [Bacteroides fragilis]